MVRRRQGIGAAAVIIVALLIVGAVVIAAVVFQFPYRQTEKGTSTSTASSVTTATSSSGISTTFSTTIATTSIIIPQGTEYQVTSSYDCVAGSTNQTFDVTTASVLQGAITASSPGVTVYVATMQEAGTTSMGHPSTWVYSSGLTNSTSFTVPLSGGSYVFWTEGADMGCGATVVTPLEQLTTVTVTGAVTLMPA